MSMDRSASPEAAIDQSVKMPRPAEEHFNVLIKGREDAQARVEAVRQAGVGLDSYGMVDPILDKSLLESRIAGDLGEVHHVISQQLGLGKHVMMCTGGYDLIHAGHASFILQGMEEYIAGRGIEDPDQLFVVVLADDDSLLASVKPPHKQDKPDQHPRPVESHDNFRQWTGDIHPRLLDLASLPVDLVGLLPSPISAESLIKSKVFKTWLSEQASYQQDPAGLSLLGKSEAERAALSTIEHFEKTIALLKLECGLIEPEQLPEDLAGKRYSDLCWDFKRAGIDPNYGQPADLWKLPSWALMFHKFIGSGASAARRLGSGADYVRLLSKNDGYSDEVAALMRASFIGAFYCDDTAVFHTSTLLDTFSWQTLLNAKAEAFKEWKKGAFS